MRRHGIQEVAIVRNADQRALIAVQKILQPVDRFEIKVVRRFVQQQTFRRAKESLSQQHAHLLPTLQFAHPPFVQSLRNIQTIQQNCRVALRRIAVVFRDHAFQFAEAHAVVVGQFGLLVESFALFQSSPKTFVAHDDGIDDTIRIKRELVLAQDTNPARETNIALLGLKFTRQDFHERRFPGTIRPGQTVTTACLEDGRHVFKKDLSAIAHAYIAD